MNIKHKTCANCAIKIRLRTVCNAENVECEEFKRETPDGVKYVPHSACGYCARWE